MTQRVLIVDDEIIICKMFTMGLNRQGFQAEYALSGSQAFALIQANPPDVIVLDLMMPDTDGFEVTRHLRSQTATEKLPIVILSAITRHNAEEEALSLGANVFVRKPVTPRDLAITIRKVIEKVNA